MKNIMFYFLLPLAVGLVGYYLTQYEKVELTYFLSEEIPVLSTNSEEESEGSIQLIEIKNTGEKPIKDILIKINDDISSYKIIKDSESDKIEEFSRNGELEINYKELAIAGNIRISITSTGNGVLNNAIDIRHSEGVAVDTLNKESFPLALIIYFIGMLVYLFLSFRILQKDSLERRAKYYKQKETLQRKKPLILTNKEWNNVRELAVENYFNGVNKYINNIEDSKFYPYLKSEKPDYLNDEQWNKIVSKAIENFEIEIEMIFSRLNSNEGKIINLLQVDRPQNFPQNKWAEIQERLNKVYLQTKKEGLEFKTLRSLKEINLVKPENLSEKNWKEYIKYFNTTYCMELLSNLWISDNPLGLISDYNNSQLDPSQIRLLNEFAASIHLIKMGNIFKLESAEQFLRKKEENRRVFKDTGYYSTIEHIAEQTIEIYKSKKLYEYALKMIRDLLNGENLPDTKPEFMSESNWHELKNIYSDVRYIKDKKQRLQKVETELEPIMQKIEKQLDIINSVLNDPTVIDRIEDYRDDFASGNFANLKKLALAYQKLRTEE